MADTPISGLTADTPQAADSVAVTRTVAVGGNRKVTCQAIADLYTIANNAVSNAQLTDVATQTIKGRNTAATGDPEDLTAAQVRGIINVEDGATADQTDAEIKTAYEANANTNAFTDADETKLDGIATGANNYSHPNHTGDVTSVGDGAQTIANDAVSNAKAANMAANTIKMRNAGTSGDPGDTKVSGLTDNNTPTNGDLLLSENAAGNLRKVDVGNLPGAQGEHSITVEAPDNAEDISIWFTNRAITVKEMRAVLIGSATPSVTWTIRHGTSRSAAGAEVVTSGTTTTSTTTGSDVTTFNDATVVADSFIWLETTAQSGTVDELHITIVYTID